MSLKCKGRSINTEPRIIPRSEHNISRADISDSALKVLYRLKKANFQALLVGGCVRDLLLGHTPKDFDIATDARPEEIQKLFSNCRLIGRRFRLAHIRYGREVIEVATFRAGHGANGDREYHQGQIMRDNIFGDQHEDAWRRDFTVNAFYYDIRNFSVIDHVGGIEDLRQNRLHLIGDAPTRYREDPVRMLRAIRFAAKLNFEIHPDTDSPITSMANLLSCIPGARLFDEVIKLLHSGYAEKSFALLRKYHLFEHLFPLTERCIQSDERASTETFILQALKNTDKRVHEGKPVNPAFLLAAMLWEPVQRVMKRQNTKLPYQLALQSAADEVIGKQCLTLSVPKRHSGTCREIWALQTRFPRNQGKRPMRFVTHPKFRAAYDFLLLRECIEPNLSELCQWWTLFQEKDEVKNLKDKATRNKHKTSSGPNRPRHTKRSPEPRQQR